MRSREPVAIDHHALDTLKFIRTSMESASSLAVPGTAGLLMGAVGVAAFALAEIPTLRAHWVSVWLVAALVALTLGALSLTRQARRKGTTLYSAPARRFVLCLGPALLAGAVLTALFVRHDLDRYLAGAWLLLYGCAVLSASAMTSFATLKFIASMGALFVVFGAISFELPTSFHNAALGFGFGGLHLLFGALIARANHEKSHHDK